MNKILVLVAAVLVLVVAGAAGYWYVQQNSSMPAFDPSNATYAIDGYSYTLANGSAEQEAAPGSAAKTKVAVFGQPAAGDLNGDGKSDAAVVLQYSGGGSGTFYYATAVMNTTAGAKPLNAILLGDRVAVQNIEIKGNTVVVNYADRKPGEAMTAQPSVGVTRHFAFENGALKEAPAPGASTGSAAALTGIKWDFVQIRDGDGFPTTKVSLTANGKTYDLGSYMGGCSVIETSSWTLLEGEKSGALCWAPGGGTELGIFSENGKWVVKKGTADEGNAETPGSRGNFTTLVTL